METPPHKHMHQRPVTGCNLQLRRLQAPLLAALIDRLSEELGKEKAACMVQEVIKDDARLAGEKASAAAGGNSMIHLLEVVREIWAENNALELKNVNLEESRLEFTVTSCAYAEMYMELGLLHHGYILSCCRDHAFIAGFNANVHLRRKNTIMEGNEYCDFCFTLTTAKIDEEP